MKIVSFEIKMNDFAPEALITMSFPIELVKEGELVISKMEFVFNEFEKAWKEYNERR